MPRFRMLSLLAVCAVAWLGVLWFWASEEHSIVNSPPGNGPIIAFGDSLTAGFGAKPGESYPDHLADILGRDILNHGVNGQTASDALRRLERDVLNHAPSVVIVCLGGNDLLQRKDPDKTFKALHEIVTRSQEAGAMVVLVGVEGLPLLSADFGSRFRELADECGALYIPDILDGIMGRGELMADPVHPNGRGYRRMAETIAAALQGWL